MDSIKIEEIAKGIALCIENAEDLLKDAKLLFENDRFPRAFSLAILALEEIGKVEVIATTLVNPNVPEEKRMERFKKDFTSHTKKQIPAILVRFLEVEKLQGLNALREKLSSKKLHLG